MRDLTKKQKNILDKWIRENCPFPGMAICDVVKNHLSFETWEELQRINNTEVLYQRVNNYVNENCDNYPREKKR